MEWGGQASVVVGGGVANPKFMPAPRLSGYSGPQSSGCSLPMVPPSGAGPKIPSRNVPQQFANQGFCGGGDANGGKGNGKGFGCGNYPKNFIGKGCGGCGFGGNSGTGSAMVGGRSDSYGGKPGCNDSYGKGCGQKGPQFQNLYGKGGKGPDIHPMNDGNGFQPKNGGFPRNVPTPPLPPQSQVFQQGYSGSRPGGTPQFPLRQPAMYHQGQQAGMQFPQHAGMNANAPGFANTGANEFRQDNYVYASPQKPGSPPPPPPNFNQQMGPPPPPPSNPPPPPDHMQGGGSPIMSPGFPTVPPSPQDAQPCSPGPEDDERPQKRRRRRTGEVEYEIPEALRLQRQLQECFAHDSFQDALKNLQLKYPMRKTKGHADGHAYFEAFESLTLSAHAKVLPDWGLSADWDGVREMMSRLESAHANPKVKKLQEEINVLMGLPRNARFTPPANSEQIFLYRPNRDGPVPANTRPLVRDEDGDEAHEFLVEDQDGYLKQRGPTALEEECWYQVTHSPAVVIREQPDEKSKMVGRKKAGKRLRIQRLVDGKWLQLHHTELAKLGVQEAWVLLDGTDMGLAGQQLLLKVK